MTPATRPLREILLPALVLVALAFGLTLTFVLGGWWFMPSSAHSASSLGWVVAWAVTTVAAVVASLLLVLQAVRRRARWLWLLVGPLVLGSLALAWATRLESYGPSSQPDAQTWVWPFTGPR